METSLVVQWLGIHLPVLETWLRSLVGTKIPRAVGQPRPWAAPAEPSHSRACAPQQEKYAHRNQRKSPCAAIKTQHGQNLKKESRVVVAGRKWEVSNE